MRVFVRGERGNVQGKSECEMRKRMERKQGRPFKEGEMGG